MTFRRGTYWRGKRTLVTGGTAGFGRVLTQSLVDAGAAVAMVDVNEQLLRDEVDRLKAAGHDVTGFVADVTNAEQVAACVDQVVERLSGLDLLANIVGRSMRGLALDTPVETYRDLLELNFLSMVHCAQAAAPHLLESGGHMINMGSLAAKSAARFLGAYPASKFAVAAFSQQLRYELGPEGVHVLLVCPGPMVRADAGQRYDQESSRLPAEARQPGGGVRVKGVSPERLAARVLRACERRQPELIVPGKARWVFAISQVWPTLGDWIIRRATKP